MHVYERNLMPEVIKNILRGGMSLVIRAPGTSGISDYISPSAGFRVDCENLRKDVRSVCGDAAKATKKASLNYNG